VNTKIRQQLARRNRRLKKRIDKRNGFSDSNIRCGKVQYELSEKQQAVHCGGLGMITQVVKQLDLRKTLNQVAPVLKLHAPYQEADHILNIAFNLLSGSTCLDHLEHRRTDEAYLEALGVSRIPDPTTAGDFCRRFGKYKILGVMAGINHARQTVWQQQPDSFFDCATIEADGHMVETSGEKKEGVGINHKGQWGYHPLIVSLAETQEVFYIVNRSGNRPSHENAAFHFDLAIKQCRKAGFRKIRLRGDTDFSQTTYLDSWDADGVEFVFGYDAVESLVKKAKNLPESQWKMLQRSTPVANKPRAKRPNHKEAVVIANKYKNLKLIAESYAEFDYQPTACQRPYRMIVVRKQIECTSGQMRLFEKDEVRYFFYITNTDDQEMPAREVIASANSRCNQENTIAQLKACHAMAAPLDNLESNWAYMVFASLAWTLKQWSGMLVREKGPEPHRQKQRQLQQRVIRMEFGTFLNSLILIPAQIIRTARQAIFRLLTYRPSVDCLLMLHDHISRPLRH
jgi:hypothetical protein